MNFVTPLHTSTKRDYYARMNAEKPQCIRVAKKFGKDYWDGDRKYGYGGMTNDGRWKPIAETMAKHYKLKSSDRILDIGCGKGYLLSELKNQIKWIKVKGADISSYALDHMPLNVILNKTKDDCSSLPFADNAFTFTYSINVFHNLCYQDLKRAIREMVRVTHKDGNSYICVESYRNEEELCNLQCWALTCQSFYSPDDWLQIFEDNGYRGDYEYIFFT